MEDWKVLKLLSSNKMATAAGIVAVVIISMALLFEPVTRNVVASDDLCSYCHVEQEYRAETRLSYSNFHPPRQEDGTLPDAEQARCVDCHLPKGLFNATYAWAHFASLTDLFGHFRYRTAERAGNWIPPRQAAAYRVRDRLFEYDSPTCDNCHVMAEIEPKRERGVNAHQKAVDEQKSCIECHYNEKHRPVDLREDAFGSAEEKKLAKAAD
jgi:nitrate/TMAO reductase-like tetraheme cytochrome c subunit